MLEPLDGELFGEELLITQYSMVYCFFVTYRLKASVQHLLNNSCAIC